MNSPNRIGMLAIRYYAVRYHYRGRKHYVMWLGGVFDFFPSTYCLLLLSIVSIRLIV